MIFEAEGNKKVVREWLQKENCFSNDLDKLYAKLLAISAIHNLRVKELGRIQEKPILLISPQMLTIYPKVLIAAGFHGDEPAGSWAILRFLEGLKEYPKYYNLSFLPLVNPTGFEHISRTNYLGQDPNRGYYHTESGKPETSEEGLVLLGQLSKIKYLAQDIFISLHEDNEFARFYIYTFETSDEPDLFSRMLHSAEHQFFEPHPDGPLEGSTVKDGIIFKFCDGSFEDLLFHNGVPMTACIETPGKFAIEKRINTNYFIIQAVGQFILSLRKISPK
ncbi:MAG: M14 family metallocarboxypeptidase [Candidatus Aminicenantales bacterium]